MMRPVLAFLLLLGCSAPSPPPTWVRPAGLSRTSVELELRASPIGLPLPHLRLRLGERAAPGSSRGEGFALGYEGWDEEGTATRVAYGVFVVEGRRYSVRTVEHFFSLSEVPRGGQLLRGFLELAPKERAPERMGRLSPEP